MSNHPLAALVAVGLLAATASAQPAGRLGLYGIVGSAAPERALFRDAADPVVTLGARLSPSVDVQAGVRFGTTTGTSGDGRDGVVRDTPAPVQVERREQTRALAVSVGLRERVGRVAIRSRASVAVDAVERTWTTQRAGSDDPAAIETTLRQGDATFAHTGLSAAAALPLSRGAGRIAPGVGAAVALSSRFRGTEATPPLRTLLFVGIPTTVPAGPAFVTIDATLGLARSSGPFPTGSPRWAPIAEAGVRVDF